MRRPLGLVGRFVVALVGTTLGSSLLLAAGAWFSYEWIEETVLGHSLGGQMDFLVEQQVSPEDFNPLGTGFQYFRPGVSPQWPAPAELLGLPPGSHHDFAMHDGIFRILIREVEPGDRAYLVYDIEDLERREELFAVSLILSVIAAFVLALVVSRRAAPASLRPLQQLVARIAGLDPERPGQRLPVDAPTPDLEPVVDVLNRHIAALDAVLERERAFASSASHELRTPLAVIASAAELHLASPAEAAVSASKIRRAVGQATALLDALLALSRSRDLPEAEALDLAKVLPELTESYQDEMRALGARIEWQLAEGTRWQGSRGVAAVIFGNLLRNATWAAWAAQAARGGVVHVEGRPDCVIVTDNGPGLDPRIANRAFDPGVSGRASGSGMGLYIARVLARRAGGDLRLETPATGGVRAVWEFLSTRT